MGPGLQPAVRRSEPRTCPPPTPGPSRRPRPPRTLIEVARDKPETTEPLRALGTKLLAINKQDERLIDGLLVLANSDQRIRFRSTSPTSREALSPSLRTPGQEAGVDQRTDVQPAMAVDDPVLL